MDVRALVGSGDRIALTTAPFLVVGVVANVLYPDVFRVGGPPSWLAGVSALVLVIGLVVWVWSAALIMRRVPRGELITEGPFAVVRHPLYTGVSLLVLPWLGFLLDTWLGAAVGLAMYAAARVHERREEQALAATFGPAWERYREGVAVHWL